MKYPKAGDLQRATGVELTSNPCACGNPAQNPYEIRSASGLEGVFADKDDAEFHAAELRREGVHVTVEQRRRPSYADRAAAGRAFSEGAERRERAVAAPTQSDGYVEPVTIRQGEHRGRDNPSSRLFAGVYPTGIVYADRAREIDGDYLRVAFLPFSTLQLEWAPGQHPPELCREVVADAEAIRARRGQEFQVSTSGQTVVLGGAASLIRPGLKRKR